MYRCIVWLLMLLMATVSPATFAEDRQPYIRYTATVVRVIDGDTIEVASLPSVAPTERVRLLGIDTPEKNEPRGEEATEYAKSLLPVGSSIIIEFDVRLKDGFGRYLGYVFLPDGQMVNQKLVEVGLAQLYTEPPNVRYVGVFEVALKEAQQMCRGIWSDLDHCKDNDGLQMEVRLKAELVQIYSSSNHPINLSGWTILSVVGNQKYKLPGGTVLGAGETLCVVSGGEKCPVDDCSQCLLWNGTGAAHIWNDAGDIGQLWDTQGCLVLSVNGD